MENEKIYCPKCASSQLYVSKKGFSTKQALFGKAVTGNTWAAIAAGNIGKDKIQITCMRCGHVFGVGEGNDAPYAKVKEVPKTEIAKCNYYKCDCGKVSYLSSDRAVCPKCGRQLNKTNIFSPKENKGGCLSLVAMLIIIIFIAGNL